MKRLLSRAAVALCVLSSGLGAQAVPVHTLSRPDAVLAHAFTYIEDVHELPNGRLAVLDRGDVSVLLANSAFTETVPVGRIGGGPGEYRVPTRLFGMAGAQFAVLERSLFHLLRYGPDGKYVDVLKPEDIDRCRNNVASPVGNRFAATDAQGRVYLEGLAIARNANGTYQLADSAPVLRWTPPCAVDTVAFTPVPHSDSGRVMVGPGGRPYIMGVSPDRTPFASETQWAVMPDGRIAIVHLAPYRVEMVDGTGRRVLGASLADAAIPVTDGHKAQWRVAAGASRPMSIISRGGGMSSAMSAPKPPAEPASWPRTLPPFPRDAVRSAPDGRVWVQRNVPAGAPTAIDVFDSGARRVQQVVLPAGRRLLGVGRGAVYLLYQDDDDLQYVERYRLPSGR